MEHIFELYLKRYVSASFDDDEDPNTRLVWMDPAEYLRLTAMGRDREFILGAGALDIHRFMGGDGVPELYVDADSGAVFGHDGRMRAGAFINSGLRRFPVLVILQDLSAIEAAVYGDITEYDILENERVFDMPSVFLPQKI